MGALWPLSWVDVGPEQWPGVQTSNGQKLRLRALGIVRRRRHPAGPAGQQDRPGPLPAAHPAGTAEDSCGPVKGPLVLPSGFGGHSAESKAFLALYFQGL